MGSTSEESGESSVCRSAGVGFGFINFRRVQAAADLCVLQTPVVVVAACGIIYVVE